MTLKAREFDLLMNKFGFKTRNSGDKFAWFEYQGRPVLWTRRSHIKGDLPCQDQIRQQMKLNEDQLREALNCELTLEGYISLLKQKRII